MLLFLVMVNPGAEIISDRNVIIWGRIKGKISAGAKGDERAFISALSLEKFADFYSGDYGYLSEAGKESKSGFTVDSENPEW